MTILEFCAKYRIVMTSVKVNHNPNMQDFKQANHYEVTFQRPNDRYGSNPNGRVKPLTLSTFFSMGLGNKGRPDAVSVLNCLVSDADAIEGTFEQWVTDLGYDADSRKALDTYLTCQRIGQALQEFCGVSAYDELRQCERE